MNNKQAKEMADKYNQNLNADIIECLESYKTTLFQDLDAGIKRAALKGYYGFTSNVIDVLYQMNFFSNEYLDEKHLDTGVSILVNYLQEYADNNGFKLLKAEKQSERSRYYTISWSDEDNN